MFVCHVLHCFKDSRSNSIPTMAKRVARRSAKRGKKTGKVAKKTMKGKKVKRSAKKTKVSKPKAELKTVQPKGAYLNASELVNNMCVETGLTRKQMKTAFGAMATIGGHELKKVLLTNSL